MIEVIGVSFSNSDKIYYFNPNGYDLVRDIFVIVDTERGEQFGKVVTDLISVNPDKLINPVFDVLRVASSYDKKINDKNLEDAKSAIREAEKLVLELGLDMRILNASWTFDRKQLLFNFLADERIDFRELAKRLASIYKTRIELRQIGVRDKAKEVGGYGQCGRKLCCFTFLDNMNSVSINMAKNQNLALNPQKINGACGRLMCCLQYENDSYDEYKKGLPKVGDVVTVEGACGKVVSVDLFNKSYKVELDDAKVVDVFAEEGVL